MSAQAVAGRWRIVEMELWDSEAMDLVGPAMIEFAPDGTGGFQFVAVEGYLDYGASENRGRPRVEHEAEYERGRAAVAAGEQALRA